MAEETKNGFPSIFQMPQEDSARNRTNALPIEPTPWYMPDVKVSPFYSGPISGSKDPPTPKSNH
jgi:hypothetical protein